VGVLHELLTARWEKASKIISRTSPKTERETVLAIGNQGA
jgi:hypothetical protein